MDEITERLLDPGYLADVDQRPIEEIREMRAECQSVETGLSYLRRVVQGRLDIVGAELERRRSGGDPADLARLVEQLPTILADHLRAPGNGRLPSTVGTGAVDPELEERVDAVVGGLDDLASLADEELIDGQTELTGLEVTISARRRDLFQRIDALQAELTRRYRTGEASVETLLR
jgi:hypothetical protein